MDEAEFRFLSRDLRGCWVAAGNHLDSRMDIDGENQTWINAKFGGTTEHFSFRLGNQLFLVRLEMMTEGKDFPFSKEDVQALADECNGQALLMPMEFSQDGWRPVHPGWGTLSMKTGELIEPTELVTDELVEISDWEVQNFACQIACTQLQQAGHKISPWGTYAEVDPSIFLEVENGSECVIVRGIRHGAEKLSKPWNLEKFANEQKAKGRGGHFVSVTVCNADQGFVDNNTKQILPIYRGHAMHVSYSGMQHI